MEFGVIGLGRIGGGLALQARSMGIRVVGLDVAGLSPELVQAGVVGVADLEEMARELQTPRVVLLYIHAGAAVDEQLGALSKVLSPGDVVADGGNSYWRDSLARHTLMQERGIGFVDLGTSGGVDGARSGACFMAGGSDRDVGLLKPLLQRLSVEGGFVHAGGPGMGHFVKLVHNGVEFGMMQAIGEGVDLLEKVGQVPDVGAVLECWRHGSVVRSWLIDLVAEAYRTEDGLKHVPGYVEDTGEVNWLVSDALDMEVPVPVISQSVMQLFASRDRDQRWASAIAAMRKGFGAHPYGPHSGIASERKTTRIHGSPPPGPDHRAG